MNSLRKWFYRPRRDDSSLLAQFYYSDEELNLVAGELDSFDGRKDPERCTSLVNQLRQCQDRVLNICMEMMNELLPSERAPRDFRVKFPDDVMQETLAGQLWFGAECLAAGSSILNREAESTRMRPLAKAVTKTIENVRNLLREQCLKPIPEYTEKIRESLKIFDRLFADFELSYVSAMVPVKSVDEHDMQQNVVVLFSDTLQRASKVGLVEQEQIDNYDPALMFTIPRLAIISGLVIFPDGPLNLDKDVKNLSELFRPFRTLLQKIRELLLTMSAQELATLEKCLCSLEEPGISIQENLKTEPSVSPSTYGPVALTSDFIHKFYANYPSCRHLTPELSSLCSSTKKTVRNERKRDRHSSKSSRTRARQERQNERFLSRLTGVEERPRARRRTRKGSSQYHHYYLPQEENCPLPCQNVSGISHRSTNSTHSHSSYANVRQGTPSHYLSSNSVDHSYDNGQAPQHSGRQHPRQHCRSSRHRRERINTIICACGSSSSHLPNDEDQYRDRPPSQHYSDEIPTLNQQQISDLHNQICLYRNPNYVAQNFQDRHQEENQYDDRDPNDSYFDCSLTIENRNDNLELSRPIANMQNCVANAVTADPEILSPNSLFEPQIDYSETFIPEIELATQSPVTLIEVHYDDCSNVENCICDTIRDRQDCQNSLVVQSNASESSKSLPTELGSQSDNFSINSSKHQELEEHQENIGSETSPDSTESSYDSLVGTPVPPPLPPIPGARSIQTNYRPYARQASESLSTEKEEPEYNEYHNEIEENEDMTSYLLSEIGEGDSSGSTSPHHSGTDDDEEVALALQAAEVAASWKARERFADSGDLIQRMFVCISGVADQLQTNYASDLRKILKCVFLMNQTIELEEEEDVEVITGKEHFPTRGDVSIEDATSSNGSEQLSVESAEDALYAIDTSETIERMNSPDEMAELDEETDETSLLERLQSGSVFVRASVFNDHSHMQYASMSPPTITMEHTYSLPVVEAQEAAASDNDSPSNDVSCSSEISINSVNHHANSSLQLEAVSDSLGQISLTSSSTPMITTISIAPVASSTAISRNPPSHEFTSQRLSSDLHNYGSDTSVSTDSVSRRHPMVQEPPAWVPDQLAPRCMACGALFTVVRRRHHCRNCGKVFCSHCSRHNVPLPHFGIWKNVRVCNACFLYYVTSSADGSSALS